MNSNLTRLGLVVLLQMVLAPRAFAHDRKVGFIYTLEWIIADADVVVRATLADTPLGRDGHWSTAKAKAHETLKGKVGGEFEFAVRGGPERLARYRGRQVLLVLDEAGRHAKRSPPPPGRDLVLNPDRTDWSIIDLSGGPNDFVVTMGLEVIDAPEQILAAARVNAEYSRGRPKPISYLIKGVPGGSDLYNRMGGLTLPGIFLARDERLETSARDLMKSKNPYYRVEGVLILGQFRSDQNIAAMKSLLTDTAVINGRHILRELSQSRLAKWDVEENTDRP